MVLLHLHLVRSGRLTTASQALTESRFAVAESDRAVSNFGEWGLIFEFENNLFPFLKIVPNKVIQHHISPVALVM